MDTVDAIEPTSGDDLVGINARRLELKGRRAAMIEAHNRALGKIDEDIAVLFVSERMLLQGLDLATIKRAEKVVYVRGKADGGARLGCIEAAIADIATATDLLKRQYFGTKNYDRWSDQRTDCEYGYGPRHGSIVFQVGLTDEARAVKGLSQQERNDAIYYLRNIVGIQAAATPAAGEGR